MSKIMIVDDEAYICTQLDERLTTMGYDVVGTAFSGDAAVDMARRLTPDLIMMDIVMPGKLDGIAATEIIKKKTDIPVIFLTAYGSDEYIQRATRVQPHSYLMKPFQEAEIRANIECALYRKKMELLLRESEKHLRTILASMREEIVLVYDRELGCKSAWIPPNLAKRYGIFAAKGSGRDAADVFALGLAEHTAARVDRVFATGDALRFECRSCFPGGDFWHDISLSPLWDESRQVDAVLGVMRDISAHMQTKQALEHAKKEWEITFDALYDWVCLTDPDGFIKRSNLAGESLLNVELGAIIGQKCCKLLHGAEEPIPKCPLQKMRRSLKRETAEFYLADRDLWIMGTADPVLGADGSLCGAVHSVRNITEIKKMEAEILKAKKLESLGVLAGGIAHDYNNILAIILGNLALLKQVRGPAYKELEIFNEVERAVSRASDLNKKFITFSKGGAPLKRIGSIRKLIADTHDLALSGTNISHELSLGDDLWELEFDEGQIRQVFINILTNAAEAMPQGGRLKTCAENETLKAGGENANLLLKAGPYVKISVQDQGVGISAQHISRIFDPYFSTKARGPQKGMGMGLATAYSIISNHDGHINVHSQAGAGTSLTIYLPAISAEGKAQSAKPDLGSPSTTVNQQSTIDNHQSSIKKILMMDDEEALRKLGGRILMRFGHEAVTAKDGAEAIELYGQALKAGQPFDAVILDLTIKGGMGGRQAIRELIKIDPYVKAIISSGYIEDPVMAKFRDYGFCGAVPKPYKLEKLRKVLQEVLSLKEEKE